MTAADATDVALAQLGPGAGGLEQMLPLVLILIVFYFLLVRPQQKRASEHKQLIEALKKNDQIVTVGGLHGRIVDVSDDAVTLEIAPNVIVRHDRGQIGSMAAKSAKPQGRKGA